MHGAGVIGVGMCPEGIEQNPVVYDLMGEQAFRWDLHPTDNPTEVPLLASFLRPVERHTDPCLVTCIIQ